MGRVEKNMAETKCGSCGSHSFELSSQNLGKSDLLFWFVQCSNCGVPIAVMEHNHIGIKLDHIVKRLDDLEAGIGLTMQSVSSLKKSKK